VSVNITRSEVQPPIRTRSHVTESGPSLVKKKRKPGNDANCTCLFRFHLQRTWRRPCMFWLNVGWTRLKYESIKIVLSPLKSSVIFTGPRYGAWFVLWSECVNHTLFVAPRVLGVRGEPPRNYERRAASSRLVCTDEPTFKIFLRFEPRDTLECVRVANPRMILPCRICVREPERYTANCALPRSLPSFCHIPLSSSENSCILFPTRLVRKFSPWIIVACTARQKRCLLLAIAPDSMIVCALWTTSKRSACVDLCWFLSSELTVALTMMGFISFSACADTNQACMRRIYSSWLCYLYWMMSCSIERNELKKLKFDVSLLRTFSCLMISFNL